MLHELYKLFCRPAVLQLAESMHNNYMDWKISHFEITSPTGHVLWVCNGPSFLKIDTHDVLSFAEKRYLWKYVSDLHVLQTLHPKNNTK